MVLILLHWEIQVVDVVYQNICQRLGVVDVHVMVASWDNVDTTGSDAWLSPHFLNLRLILWLLVILISELVYVDNDISYILFYFKDPIFISVYERDGQRKFG